MSSPKNLEVTSYNEPLFVLRYRGSQVFLVVILFTLAAIFFGLFAVFPAKSQFATLFKIPVFGLLALLSLRSVVELLSFKEIRLYNERLVQVRKWGETEVQYANASLATWHRGLRRKSIFNQDMETYRGWLPLSFLFWRIIAYEETLADPKDVERFNCLLAYLSGRRIQELEGNLDRLIKEEANP